MEKEQEIWKDIEGYNGKYQVSNLGNIKSFLRAKNGHIMAKVITSRNREMIQLYDRKSFFVHRLVAMAFVKGYQDGFEVNHKDENPRNNRWDNLEWVTHDDNIHYGTLYERVSQSLKNGRKPVNRYPDFKPLDGEEWKDIEGFEGLYMVSNFGRIRSLKTKKNKGGLKSPCLNRKRGNRYYIQLVKDKKIYHFSVHRLVAMAFVEGYQPGLEVNHKDENPQNNHADNLEWCTSKYNANYGTRNDRVTKKNSKPIVQMTIEGVPIATYPSVNEAARQTGYNLSALNNCCRGIKETAYGYMWRYMEKGERIQLCMEYNKPDYKPVDNKPRLVVQMNLDNKIIAMYESGYKAGIALGVRPGAINLCCNGHNKTAYGFKWRYVYEGEEIIIDKEAAKRVYYYKPTTPKPVIQMTLECEFVTEYSSIHQAAKALGVSAGNIRNCCKGKHRTHSAYGYKWKFKNEQ